MEEKYGAVTVKMFYDFNNQKLQVEGGFAYANLKVICGLKHVPFL